MAHLESYHKSRDDSSEALGAEHNGKALTLLRRRRVTERGRGNWTMSVTTRRIRWSKIPPLADAKSLMLNRYLIILCSVPQRLPRQIASVMSISKLGRTLVRGCPSGF
jgi:hypothetical protein